MSGPPWQQLPAPAPTTGWWPVLDAVLAVAVETNVAVTPGFHFHEILAEIIAEMDARTMAFTYHGVLAVARTITDTITAGIHSHQLVGAAPSITNTITTALAKTRYLADPISITNTVTTALTLSLAPGYDGSAVSTEQVTVSSPVTFSWLDTAAANAYGIVAVYNFGTMDLSATATVTWGATTLSSLGNGYLNNTPANGFVWVFGAYVPSGLQTVEVQLIQASKTFDGYGASFSYLNVSSVGSLQTAYGSSTSPSLSVSSGPDATVWGTVMSFPPLLSAFSLTTRQSTWLFIAGDSIGASGTVTVSATASSDPWAVVGLELINALQLAVAPIHTNTITPALKYEGVLGAALGHTNTVTPAFKYEGVLAVAPSITNTVTAALTKTRYLAAAPSITNTVTPGLKFGGLLATAPSITNTVTPGLTESAPPTFDSVAGAIASSVASGTAVTWSDTAAASAYGIILIANDGTMDLSATATVTWGATTLSSLGNVYLNNNPADGFVWVFGTASVPSGAQTLSATLTEAGKTWTGQAASISYLGVTSVGSLQTAFGTGPNPSTTATSATGHTLFVAIADTHAMTSARSFNNRQNNNANGIALNIGDQAGSASPAVSVTDTGSTPWAIACLDLL